MGRAIAIAALACLAYLLVAAVLGIGLMHAFLPEDSSVPVHGMIFVVPLIVLGYAACLLPFPFLITFCVTYFSEKRELEARPNSAAKRDRATSRPAPSPD